MPISKFEANIAQGIIVALNAIPAFSAAPDWTKTAVATALILHELDKCQARDNTGNI